MNDLERDLIEVFHDDARRVPTPARAPEGLRRSARRRQAVFGGVVALAGLAVVAGVIAGATTLLSGRGGPEPAVEGPRTTDTMNGITITYPQSWHLIDPDTAGLNGPGSMGESPLPRIVLALAPTQATETFGCPGQVGGDAASSSLMTVQEQPLASVGPAATPWPVELGPMEMTDTSESGCYQDWTFERARWTASGRTFDARIGFSPDASDEEHDAMVAAFASMTFEASGEPASSAVLATGTAGGESWRLIAGKDSAGLTLTLEGDTWSKGFGGFLGSPESLQKTTRILGHGSEMETVVFGPAPAGVVRVEATWGDGISATSADVLDVPDQIDADLNAYLLIIPSEGRIHVRGFDASGEIVIQGRADATESPAVEGALEDGRHFGFIRSVDVSGRTIEFDLAYWLSGEEANEAYHEATGETGPVPNDHFVVNDNPRLRSLWLSPELRLRLLDWNRCCDTFFDGDLALFAQAIEIQSDVTDLNGRRYSGLSQWWITVRDGVVTEIEEQYAP